MTVTFTGDDTALVWILKLAEIAPAGTVIFAGNDTEAAGFADKSIICPPAGAAPFNVTVPTMLALLITDEGDKVKAETAIGFIITTPMVWMLPIAAVISTFTGETVVSAWTLKLTELAPAGTVTEPGIVI